MAAELAVLPLQPVAIILSHACAENDRSSVHAQYGNNFMPACMIRTHGAPLQSCDLQAKRAAVATVSVSVHFFPGACWGRGPPSMHGGRCVMVLPPSLPACAMQCIHAPRTYRKRRGHKRRLSHLASKLRQSIRQADRQAGNIREIQIVCVHPSHTSGDTHQLTPAHAQNWTKLLSTQFFPWRSSADSVSLAEWRSSDTLVPAHSFFR